MSREFALGGDPAADARALRDAFGCFTTGVTVVTTRRADGTPVGFTANSFASVSLEPPLALVCVDLAAKSLPALEQAGAFAVNVLHADQRDIARRFTRKEGDRFEGTPFKTWETGAPVLDGCMANFECETHQAFDAGDHRVFVGRIRKVRIDPDHQPLVFLRGGYCGVTPG
ncbi:MAG TPA: flavin reductase family protein [Caulobacteraceae bacterium]|nr:flavin reductase family protein [Caulobacteraceae bacterium]